MLLRRDIAPHSPLLFVASVAVLSIVAAVCFASAVLTMVEGL